MVDVSCFHTRVIQWQDNKTMSRQIQKYVEHVEINKTFHSAPAMTIQKQKRTLQIQDKMELKSFHVFVIWQSPESWNIGLSFHPFRLESSICIVLVSQLFCCLSLLHCVIATAAVYIFLYLFYHCPALVWKQHNAIFTLRPEQDNDMQWHHITPL